MYYINLWSYSPNCTNTFFSLFHTHSLSPSLCLFVFNEIISQCGLVAKFQTNKIYLHNKMLVYLYYFTFILVCYLIYKFFYCKLISYFAFALDYFFFFNVLLCLSVLRCLILKSTTTVEIFLVFF